MLKRLIALMIVGWMLGGVVSAGVVIGGARTSGGGETPPDITDYTADANCMGAWFMNGTTTELDRSGNGANLAESSGSIPTSATVPNGYSGTSRDFEYDDSEMLQQNDDESTDIHGADQTMSIVAWIKAESLKSDTAEENGIVNKHYPASGEQQYRLSFRNIGSSVIKLYGYLSGDGETSTTAIGNTDFSGTEGAWYHLAMVYNDTDIRLYVNGILDSGADNPKAHTSGIFNSTSNFRVGSTGATGFYFDGLIDEVAIFNRALSPAEITEIMTYGLDGTKGGND